MLTPEMAEAIVQGGQRGTLSLTALYDDRCPLCRRLKACLGEQTTLAPIEFLPADSQASHMRFPLLDHDRTTLLNVVSSDGAVYEGERAWLVCAWALPAWQPVTEQFGTGLRLRLLRLVTRALDGYRHRVLARNGPCDEFSVAAPTTRSVR